MKRKGRWEVIKTIWPYESGYGTVNKRMKMVLDTGLSKEEAEKRRKTLNQKH